MLAVHPAAAHGRGVPFGQRFGPPEREDLRGAGPAAATLPLEAVAQLLRQVFERFLLIGVGMTVAVVVVVVADPDEAAVVAVGEFEAEGKRPLQCRVGRQRLNQRPLDVAELVAGVRGAAVAEEQPVKVAEVAAIPVVIAAALALEGAVMAIAVGDDPPPQLAVDPLRLVDLAVLLLPALNDRVKALDI
ncbi:MAG: hypothetical protein QOH16_3110 [Gaiellaceae bacterium]|nr:hypothetical protein [Gaiellaceae bacterium]